MVSITGRSGSGDYHEVVVQGSSSQVRRLASHAQVMTICPQRCRMCRARSLCTLLAIMSAGLPYESSALRC